MTGQISPRLRIHHQDWNLCSAADLARAVPSSEALGFETQMSDTSNWSGRVDGFEVVDSRLLLTEIEVNLTDDYRNLVPENGVRTETVQRYWGTVISRLGESSRKVIERRMVSFTFKDLFIDYTGTLVGGRDLDFELYFHGGYQKANRYRHRIILSFDKGVLDEGSIRYEKGSRYDNGTPRLYWS